MRAVLLNATKMKRASTIERTHARRQAGISEVLNRSCSHASLRKQQFARARACVRSVRMCIVYGKATDIARFAHTSPLIWLNNKFHNSISTEYHVLVRLNPGALSV